LNFLGVEGLSLFADTIVLDGATTFALITSGGFGGGSTTVTIWFSGVGGDVTDGRAEKLLHNLGFSTSSNNTADRHVDVTFNDGGNSGAGGAKTDTTTVTVNIVLGDP